MRRRQELQLLAALSVTFPASVLAQEAAQTEAVDLRAEWTQFLSASVAGEGDRSPRYGGRLDGHARLDGEALGLWDGLTINAQAEFGYGESTNRIGSRLLLPANAAMTVPELDDESFDLSLNIVQRIGKVRIQAGKINLLDASSAIPIVAGGGKEGFQHMGLAAPPGLISSPKIFGAIASAPAGRLILTLGIWTPEDWTRRYLPKRAFSNGVNGMFTVLLPARIRGLQGYHTVTIYGTSRKVDGRAEFPDIDPPPGSGSLLPRGPGGTHVRYAVQQYLWQDPDDPKRGWGFFGHVGASIGAPGILDWSMTAGLAGSAPFAGRPGDRFGIGYFRFSLTKRLQTGLAPLHACATSRAWKSTIRCNWPNRCD